MTQRSTPIEERTMLHVLRRGVAAHPEAPALSDPNIALTYAGLWDRACSISGGLRGIGIRPGDRVLMMLDNSADCFVLLLATSFVGAELVPVNPTWRDAYLTHAIAEAGCVAAVADSHYLDAVRSAADGRLRLAIARGPEADTQVAFDASWEDVLCADPVEPIEVGPGTTPVVIFTSGTTGKSKGVRTTHAQIVTMCSFSPHAGYLGRNERWYVPTPMFHALGLFGGAFAPLIQGASSYVAPNFSPSRFWTDVRQAQATTVLGVGTMIDFLVGQPPRADDRDNPLQVFNTVPRPRTAEQFRERFDVLVTTSYGSSECGTSFADGSTDPVYRSLGRPRPGLRVRLVDPEGEDVAPGEPGELLLQPEHRAEFTPEYVNNPEASALLERDGWFPTGDLLRCDEDGRYYYVDRLRDSIRRRGENISSVEVELAVGSLEGVLECAAIGVGDPADQEVMIVVIRAEGSQLTEERLLTHAVERLPHYAVPRFVAFTEEMPRTPTGKIQKMQLRAARLHAWDREEAGFVVARPDRRAPNVSTV